MHLKKHSISLGFGHALFLYKRNTKSDKPRTHKPKKPTPKNQKNQNHHFSETLGSQKNPKTKKTQTKKPKTPKNQKPKKNIIPRLLDKGNHYPCRQEFEKNVLFGFLFFFFCFGFFLFCFFWFGLFWFLGGGGWRAYIYIHICIYIYVYIYIDILLHSKVPWNLRRFAPQNPGNPSFPRGGRPFRELEPGPSSR